jgi:drug/metabolite transporter (DMT)-like permease
VLKQLTREADNLTLMGMGALAQSAMAVPFAVIWWVQPSLHDLGIMLCLGLVALVLQNTMLAAYRIGDVSVLSPLDYFRLLTGGILGFFAFGEVPTKAILIGAGLIIIANVIASQRPTNRAETKT